MKFYLISKNSQNCPTGSKSQSEIFLPNSESQSGKKKFSQLALLNVIIFLFSLQKFQILKRKISKGKGIQIIDYVKFWLQLIILIHFILVLSEFSTFKWSYGQISKGKGDSHFSKGQNYSKIVHKVESIYVFITVSKIQHLYTYKDASMAIDLLKNLKT